MLQTVPSLSIFACVDGDGDGEQRIQNSENLEAGEDGLHRTVTIGDGIADAAGGSDFSFVSGNGNMDLIKEEKEEDEDIRLDLVHNLDSRQEVEPVSPPMYLATGLGIDSVDFGSSLELVLPKFDGDEDMEEYYKRMVDDFPCHPFFLRKYAQILQSKGDLDVAEDYFFRATLADPDSTEILLEYAQFVWEVRHDCERALTYFERATQVAPQDSNVLAAYARFVWQEESENEADGGQVPHKKIRDGLNISNTGEGKENQLSNLAVDPENGFKTEEDYKRLIEENPQNPSVLRNYAQFLHQSKGDHEGAEVMYSRAIEADPTNGEALVMYAKLVWQLHHDFHKASCFFERAVEASPQDSQILGAYASFVWETDKDEEEGQDHVHELPPLDEAISTVIT
ncbi:uncharacterized protein LOC116193281 isoform X1 [Punica granatum]|uniref:Uncharacterized protein LOC116193281 isoform X1 n=1 Tax=Punica granatum TaxID=22663 RepID=A0A6P8C889_PUNGR|nr:uncharacterized protein LOC116193281 isoform X1 [Punica granatum]